MPRSQDLLTGQIHHLVETDGTFDVRDFEAVGNGIADDTVAIQAAFDAADAASIPQNLTQNFKSNTVYFPRGHYITGVITWKGQSVVGDGSGNTFITGKDSEDILFADPSSFPNLSPPPFRIEGVTLSVDDTTDVSGGLNRHGVGNACIAVEFNDGTGDLVGAWRESILNDVRFRSTSYTTKGKNASAGEYFQGVYKQSCRYTNVRYFRLVHSLYEDFPTLNVTSVELYRDYNYYEELFLNGCKNGPRLINNHVGYISGSQIGAHDTSLIVTGVTSQQRANSASMSIGPWFSEQTGTSTGTDVIQISGRDHLLSNLVIQGIVNGAKVILDTKGATWVTGFLSNGDTASPLTITGDDNNISGLVLKNNTVPIVDTGDRNTVETSRYQSDQKAGGIRPIVDGPTPSILGYDKWSTGGGTTITDFDDGYEGKVLIFVADNALTITDGTNIFLSRSANFNMVSGDTLTLIQKANGEWHELARSVAAANRTLTNDATPSVLRNDLFLTGGTTTITDFDDGHEGKIIRILAEHSIKITDGTNIFLHGSADYDMVATDTLTLVQKADGKWYELARSVNTV